MHTPGPAWMQSGNAPSGPHACMQQQRQQQLLCASLLHVVHGIVLKAQLRRQLPAEPLPLGQLLLHLLRRDAGHA